jgi:hypothetical protein
MLDVHLPHGKLHGFWEFLLHLFTITVGLLIAVQIESFVEWRHHVHLAEEARTSLRAEIENNLKDLKQAQPGLKAWREQIDGDLAAMQLIQDHPNDPRAQHTTLTLTFSMVSMPDTAWKTAQTTGALAYMPYEEAQRYSGIYQAQAALLAMQDKPMEDVAAINGLIARYHWRDSGKITAEQASAVAEKLGQMKLHLSAGNSIFYVCIEQDQAFLENRKPQENFNETLH